MPVIPLRKLRQDDYEFEANLGYIVESYLKKKIQKGRKRERKGREGKGRQSKALSY
jgi:hypothetical protein